MAKKNDEAIAGCMVIIFTFGCWIPCMIVARAFVFTTIWNWYLPSGLGLPEMTLVTAYGLSVVIGMFTYRLTRNKTGDLDKDASVTEALVYIGKGIFNGLGILAVFLGFAWIGTLFA